MMKEKIKLFIQKLNPLATLLSLIMLVGIIIFIIPGSTPSDNAEEHIIEQLQDLNIPNAAVAII